MNDVIKFENLSKKIGRKVILHNLSFSIGKGKITGIVGPNGAGKSTMIKTMLGLYHVTSGNIYIDGEILEESYGREVIQNPGRAAEPITLGEDEYFVMGDNRNNSSDSRDPSVGNIHRKDIIGRAWVRIWPFSKFGVLKHQ